MMAGLDSQDQIRSRVDKVCIIHAGENLDDVVRPLAEVLEVSLKLGEQAEYKRAFRPENDMAEYVWGSINQVSIQESRRLVIIISELFILECSKNKALYQKIKTKLCSRDSSQSFFALVSPCGTPPDWPGIRCINLSAYVQSMESGNLAEAILQQWFGRQAKLPVLPETTVHGPDKVKVIHAMTGADDRKKYWGKVVTAIEEVANPENTTQARLHFKQECSIAKTLLSDLEEFSRCAESRNISAVILWCKDMLSVLSMDLVSKAKFIDIVCLDTKPQKLYAHFLFGINDQQMRSFSQRLWNHLSYYRHMAYIESSQLERPDMDYTPFAQLFLGYWTGTKREVKSPEESIDPTITSLESSLEGIDLIASNGEDRSGVNQFHPEQDQNGGNLVPNGESTDYERAHATQQVALALRSGNSIPQDRLLTNKGSWPNHLAASAGKSRELQCDGASNPPAVWSGLQGPASFPESREGTQSPSSGVVCQAAPGSCGKNKMAAGSIGSVPVDSVEGSKINDVRGASVHSGQTVSLASQTPSKGSVSLPAGATGVQTLEQAYQPVSHGGGTNTGHNRIAASGFSSHTAAGQYPSSSTSQDVTCGGSVPDSLMSLEGSSQSSISTQPHRLLSANQNPLRLTSDAENLDQQLNAESQRLGLSDRTTAIVAGQPQSLQLFGSETDNTRGGSLTTSQSMPVMHFRADNQNTNPSSLAEGTNFVQNGEIPASFDEESNTRTSRLLRDLSVGIKRGLKERLDPLKPAIFDWRDLADYFKVEPVTINYWKSLASSTFSPTENLIEWIVTKQNDFSVDRFIKGLKAIERNDVCKFLDKALDTRL